MSKLTPSAVVRRLIPPFIDKHFTLEYALLYIVCHKIKGKWSLI